MVPVDKPEAVPHQLAADAPALTSTFNTKPWQVPVRERRMACVHLFEHREEIPVLIRGHALRDLRDHGVAVGFHVRGEPQGHGLKFAEPPHRTGT